MQTSKHGSTPSKASNVFHNPLTAVYTNCALTSSGTRANHSKPYTQPKIMSPATNHSTRGRKYVSSLSIIPKEKVPKIVVLPSIDKDIAVHSARSASSKTPSADKSSKGEPKSAKHSKPHTKYVSFLHTSLSTEWRRDTLDKEASQGEKEHTASCEQIDCNYKTNSPPATRSETGLLSCAGYKTDFLVKLHRSEASKGRSSVLKTNKQNMSMDSQTVRIQHLPPTGKSFTIKDTVVTDAKRVRPTGNSVQLGGNVRQGLRPRMLPKSRFRVKIQKCHHNSLNISDSLTCSDDKRGKTLDKPSRSVNVVSVQGRKPQRSFSVTSNVF